MVWHSFIKLTSHRSEARLIEVGETPKENLAIGRFEGVDQIMADAVAAKFIPAPLTADQVKELVQIPR